MEPDAARRMAVASGLNRNAKHLAHPLDGQCACGETLGQSAGDDFGSVNRWITELCQKRQPADMVLMAVAEDQRVCWRDCGHIGQASRRRALAEVKHKAFAPGFDRKARRTLFADAGNESQQWPILVHYFFNSNSFGRGRPPSVPIPKFARFVGTLSCELRNQRDPSKYIILVRFLDLKFL